MVELECAREVAAPVDADVGETQVVRAASRVADVNGGVSVGGEVGVGARPAAELRNRMWRRVMWWAARPG